MLFIVLRGLYYHRMSYFIMIPACFTVIFAIEILLLKYGRWLHQYFYYYDCYWLLELQSRIALSNIQFYFFSTPSPLLALHQLGNTWQSYWMRRRLLSLSVDVAHFLPLAPQTHCVILGERYVKFCLFLLSKHQLIFLLLLINEIYTSHATTSVKILHRNAFSLVRRDTCCNCILDFFPRKHYCTRGN